MNLRLLATALPILLLPGLGVTAGYGQDTRSGHTVQIVRGADRGFRVMVDGAVIYIDRDDELVDLVGTYGTPGRSYALIAEASGGNGCPSMYRAILLDGPRPLPTAQFGTCSDLPKVEAQTGTMTVNLPTLDGKSIQHFTVDGTRITKTATALGSGNQGPALASGTELFDLVNGKPISETVRLRAVVQAIEKSVGAARARTIVDYALGGPGTAFESRGTFVVAMACMPHDCARNQARVAFDRDGRTWISIRTNGMLSVIGEPPFEIRRALQS